MPVIKSARIPTLSPTVAEQLDYLREAAAGTHGADQQRLAETALLLGATLLAKNKDYGSSAWATPALAPHLTCGESILVRMSDKIHRINNLLGQADDGLAVTDETVNDTFLDLAGYSLLYVARPRPGKTA